MPKSGRLGKPVLERERRVARKGHCRLAAWVAPFVTNAPRRLYCLADRLNPQDRMPGQFRPTL